MAVTPLNPKAFYHARSISLPSRSHPLIPEFEENLRRLQAPEASSSSPLMSHRLSGLQDLIDCVENLLLLPLSQRILTQFRQEKWVDELLDGSLSLLDACGTAKDILVQTRDHASKLQSALRRRVDECRISTGVDEYLTSRKRGMEAVQKALKILKVMKNKCSLPPLNTDPEAVSLIRMLREVEIVTITVLESLLSSISRSTVRSKPSSRSLVSRLVHHKQAACKGAAPAEITEFEKVDSALSSLIHHKGKSVDLALVVHVQKEVGQFEQSIQDLEEGLEFISRRLIKTRVSLLNILNH